MNDITTNPNLRIAVVGLGYVGLPLACLFAGKYPVVGFDINSARVADINRGEDETNEATGRLQDALQRGMVCTSDLARIADCNVYIIAVPTPVDELNHPDLKALEMASLAVGSVLKKGDTVIYESTVNPGATENFCAPILCERSGLRLNEDFWLGYSPERINPADTVHTIEKICKITSGSTPEAARFIDDLYNSVLTNGTYLAPSIKVAEAAKIMENTQRDINIAFMNEMQTILTAMNIDINEVIDAASTKWNFLKFTPGFVGGHCIGVDPYYLIQGSKESGVYPRLICEARRINDSMSRKAAERIIGEMAMRGIRQRDSRILLLGFTFKENCPDIRNTKIFDIYKFLKPLTDRIDICDPLADPAQAKKIYGIDLVNDLGQIADGVYDAVITCVPHAQFAEVDLRRYTKPDGLVHDIRRDFTRKPELQTN